jgi:hypothetical protein
VLAKIDYGVHRSCVRLVRSAAVRLPGRGPPHDALQLDLPVRDEMLVNTHLYGVPGAYAPVPHLRRLAGGELFDIYATSFQRVWSRAVSVWPDS